MFQFLRLCFFLVLLSTTGYGQVQVCLGDDIIACDENDITIQNCDFADNGFTFMDNANAISMTDDEFSAVVPLGFVFNFYGNDYAACVVSSNGRISFDLGRANAYCDWDLQGASPLPSNGPNDFSNTIMLAYEDFEPTATGGPFGNVQYQTLGTAPNRRFVLLYRDITHYDGNTCNYLALILNEGENSFETHLGVKVTNPTWNNGLAVQGCQNSSGTVAHITPGRNITQWTANQEGKRWTPTSPGNTSNYTISTIPYEHVSNVQNSTAIWSSTLGQTFPYSPTLTVSGAANTTVGYYLTVISNFCGSSIASVSDTTWIDYLDLTVAETLITCPGGNDGTAEVQGVPGSAQVNYLWNDPSSQTNSLATNLSQGLYECTISGDLNCVLEADVQEIPGMVVTIADRQDVACGNDGFIELGVTSGTPNYTYQWTNSSNTTNLASNLSSGVYECIVTDANGCAVSITDTIRDPGVFGIASMTPDLTVCPDEPVELLVQAVGGTGPYLYSWTTNNMAVGTDNPQLNIAATNPNQTYCVVVTEFCGETDTACVDVSTFQRLEPNLSSDILNGCSPQIFTFSNLSTNPSIIQQTIWEIIPENITLTTSGMNDLEVTLNVPGFHDVIMNVISTDGCTFVNTFQDLVQVYPSPIANFDYNPHQLNTFESTAYMQDLSSSDVTSLKWVSPGSIPSQSSMTNPVFHFPEEAPGNYPVTLSVMNDFGCTDTITRILEVEHEIIVYVPNTFTPDGDEFNNVWRAEVLGADEFDADIFIFDRWGGLVWESHDLSVGWDGTFNGSYAQNGTYVWKMHLKNPYTGEREEHTGHVNLLR
ncbi:MAG: T9SS type B sorting domain-containing protein [Crocinitomicaceae bacterium]